MGGSGRVDGNPPYWGAGGLDRSTICQRVKEADRLDDRQVGDFLDWSPHDRHRPALGLQPRALARSGRGDCHVALDLVADELGVGLLEAALDVGDDALVGHLVLVDPTALRRVAHLDALALDAKEKILSCSSVSSLTGVRAEKPYARRPTRAPRGSRVAVHAGLAPGRDGALGQAQLPVGDHQSGIDLQPRAQAGARPGRRRGDC